MKLSHILAATAILLLSACVHPKALVYKGVQRFGVRQSGLTSTMLMIDIKLYNPNQYAMKLRSSNVGVYVNTVLIGNAVIDNEIVIPKNDTFVLPALLNVNLMKVLPNAYQIISSKEIDLKLDGAIVAGIQRRNSSNAFFFTLPIRYEGKQKIDIGL